MLTDCRECGQPVAARAKTCPGCGVRKPTATKAEAGLDALAAGTFKLGLMICLLAVVVVACIVVVACTGDTAAGAAANDSPRRDGTDHEPAPDRDTRPDHHSQSPVRLLRRLRHLGRRRHGDGRPGGPPRPRHVHMAHRRRGRPVRSDGPPSRRRAAGMGASPRISHHHQRPRRLHRLAKATVTP